MPKYGAPETCGWKIFIIDMIMRMFHLYLDKSTVSPHIPQKVFVMGYRIKDFSVACPVGDGESGLC
jgi:hypothetical protein